MHKSCLLLATLWIPPSIPSVITQKILRNYYSILVLKLIILKVHVKLDFY